MESDPGLPRGDTYVDIPLHGVIVLKDTPVRSADGNVSFKLAHVEGPPDNADIGTQAAEGSKSNVVFDSRILSSVQTGIRRFADWLGTNPQPYRPIPRS